MVGPVVVMIAFKHEHVLEITAKDRLVGWVVCHWHLEHKSLIGSLLSAGELVGVHVEQVRVSKKPTTKPSKKQNVLSIFLNGSAALPVWELFVVEFYQSPL